MGNLKDHSAPSPVFFIIGYSLALLFFGWYYLHGYNPWVGILWVTAIGFFCVYYFPQRERNGFSLQLNRYDLYGVLGLYALFIPIYLWFIYLVPYQVGADELHFLRAIYYATIDEPSPDPFSVSGYLGFSKLIFIVFGKLSKIFMGEINFLNLRIIHAICGLLIIVPAYTFYRLFSTRLVALGTTVLLMSQHALVNISRMLSRNNLPVLNILTAFLLLFIGLKRKCPWYSFAGGVVAGLSFYHYCVGRVIFIIWLVFIALVALFYREEIPFRQLRKIVLASMFGFIITAGPIVIQSTYKADQRLFEYGKKQLLIFKAGRENQRNWYNLSTIEEGVRLNIKNGLTVFNRRQVDWANQYPNLKHGFVDPLTGILIWIGLISILWRRKKNLKDLLVVSSFLTLWMIFIFISNTTPNYTRLLIILPFVALLTAEGLRVIIHFADRAFLNHIFKSASIQSVKNLFFVFGVVIIFYWNGFMWGDYIKKGLIDGDYGFMGKTLRYVESRMGQKNYSFYTVYNEMNSYFTHGFHGRFEKVVGDPKKTRVVQIENIINDTYGPPFTIFIFQNHWKDSRQILLEKYPQMKIHSMNSDASYLAIEVLNQTGPDRNYFRN